MKNQIRLISIMVFVGNLNELQDVKYIFNI